MVLLIVQQCWIYMIVYILSTNATPQATPFSSNDLNNYLEDSIAQYRLNVHKKLQQSRRRSKREIHIDDFLHSSNNNAYEVQLQNIIPIQSVPTIYPMKLTPFVIKNKTHLAVVNFKSDNEKYSSLSSIYYINESSQTSKFQLLQNFSTSGGVHFEFADLGSEKYAIFLDSIGDQSWLKESVYKKSFSIYQYLPQENALRPFQYKSKILALGGKSVKVFLRQGIPFFVTANSFYDNGLRYQVKSTLHAKTTKGFELIQEFDTMSAQDVEVITINGERFILFVNHQDNSGNVDIYSSVYKERSAIEYNGIDGPFALYQSILTHGAKDFEYFMFEGNHYLAVANEYTKITSVDMVTQASVTTTLYDIDSVIYWWTGKIWVEWQRIPTQGAVKWTYFQAEYGEPMLVVANSKSQAVIYTYDPLRGIFKPTQLQGLNPFQWNSSFIPNVRSVMPFKMMNDTYLAVANYEKSARSGYNIFKLQFNRTSVQSLEPTIPEIISKLLEKMEKNMEEVKENLASVLSNVVGKIMTKRSNQNITSKVYFEELEVNTISTSEVFYQSNISNNPLELMHKEISKLKDLLKEHENKIILLQKQLNDAVLISENANITGKKTLGDMKSKYLISNLTFVNGYVDRTNISNLKINSWSKSTNQNITGCFTFKKLSVTGNLTVNGKINDISIDNLMTTNTEQTVTGSKSFYNEFIVASDLNLKNFTLNGLMFPDDLMKRSGIQTISGYKTFKNLEFNKPVIINALIDQVNITDFNINKVTTSGTQNITQKVIFQNGFTVTSDVIIKGLVDGTNLDKIKENIDASMGDQIIQTNTTFKKVYAKNSVQVDSMNGYNMSEVVTTNEKQRITANISFENDIIVEGDLMAGIIDGIKLSSEAVTKGGNQEISGVKTIFSPKINANTIVTGLLNGVNLSYWMNNIVLKNSKKKITGKKVFTNGAIIKKQLYVKHINNITLENLKSDLVSLNTDGIWNSQFIFENVLVFGDCHVNGYVNGLQVPIDLIKISGNQVVHGKKEFASNVNIGGSFISLSNLNNENISFFFENVVKNNTDEDVNAILYFHGDTYFKKNITFLSKLNNLSFPNDVVTLNTYQNVKGHLLFLEPSLFLNKVITTIVNVNTTVNGIDLYEMEKNALYKDRNQTVNASLVFLGGISCYQNLSVAGLINGINLEELVNNSVFISKSQEITGSVIFENDVLFNSTVTTPGTINGIDVRQLNNTVLKKTAKQVEIKDLFLKQSLTVESLKLSDNSTINGVNLKKFLENAVKFSTSIKLNGNLSFQNNLTIENLYVDYLNDVNTSNILLTSTNQTMLYHQFFSFAQMKNVIVNGLIDTINITEIDNFLLRSEGDQIITAKYKFENDFIVQNNITVNGNVNGIELKSFIESSVHLTSDETIFGSKNFDKVSFGDVIFMTHLNLVNVSELIIDALALVGNQEICHYKFFNNNISTTNLLTTNITTLELVNNINLVELDKTSVRLYKDQILEGNYYFNGILSAPNMFMSGKLNNANLATDFMTTYGNQNVDGYKVFINFTISGNLNLSGLIDGVNISYLDSNRVTLSGNQFIFGEKKFSYVKSNKDIEFPNNATVNNLDISVDLILRYNNSLIDGNKFFTDVYVNGDLSTISGIINGVNIIEMKQQALMLNSDKAQWISGNQLFFEALNILGNLSVVGTINGVNVNQPKEYNQNISMVIESDMQSLVVISNATCQSISNLIQISSSENFFNGFEKLYTSILPSSQVGKINSFISGNQIFVSVARAPGSGCGAGFVLLCSINMQCDVIQTIYTNAKTMEFIEYNSSVALYVANEKADQVTKGCKNEPEIYVWSVNSFLPYSQYLSSAQLAELLYFHNNISKFLTQTYGSYDEVSDTYQRPNSLAWNDSNLTYIVVSWEENNVDFIDILNLNGTDMTTLKVEQTIRVGTGNNLGFGKILNEKMILSISSDISNENNIYIKNSATGSFEFYQKLSHSASSVKFNNMYKKSYLVYASSLDGLGLCYWKGISGFVNCHPIQSSDASYVEIVTTADGVFIIAGGKDSLMVYKAIIEGNTVEYQKPIC
ncbi:uncharacterized protein LOC100199482 isoform X1 [Hydra vulgaris]|uniref:uncharacterized protein LOC100199482 isoform X1 n=2 Tax=Hydra vulgaris TaxID=6087 RepID=UPI001F5F8AA7|nr:uncharacterized protein LOC100199482 isoform X1 [Hydra vulgaris]